MILKGAAATRYLARPDAGHAGLLLYGADPMRVALKRQDTLAALLGPGAEAEMRLIRLPAADLRRDAAALDAEMRAQGFFPGPRAVLVEDAGDGLTAALTAALADWRAGDARVVVTAGALPASSSLRKLFEGHAACVAIAVYDDPPSAEDIAQACDRAGLARPQGAAGQALAALAATLDPAEFRLTVERLAIYKLGDPAPLTPDEIAALAPATVETEADAVADAVAEGRETQVVTLARRAAAQGLAPVTLCLAVQRHLRLLHRAATDPAGPEAALNRARLAWTRRDRALAQSRRAGAARLERALAEMVETDLALRSATRAPAGAVIERALLRAARLLRG